MQDPYFTTIPKGTLVYMINKQTNRLEGRPATREYKRAKVDRGHNGKIMVYGVSHMDPVTWDKTYWDPLEGVLSPDQYTYNKDDNYPGSAETSEMVQWGEIQRTDEVKYLMKVDAPEIKALDEAPARQAGLATRLAHGSEWELTQDTTMLLEIERHGPFLHHWQQYYPGKLMRSIDLQTTTIPKGSRIKVVSKKSVTPYKIPDVTVWADLFENTPVLNRSTVIQVEIQNALYWVSVKDLSTARETKVVINPVFVYYDTATKEFYRDFINTTERDADHKWIFKAVFTTAFTQAKKMKTMGVAKTGLLSMAGYFEDIPDSSDVDWSHSASRKLFDIPSTWVLREYDKISKALVAEHDLQHYLKQAWKLRDLTVNYGSAVRNFYKSLEKSGKLDAYQAVLIFKKPDKYDWKITDADLEAVKEHQASFTGEKTKLIAGNRTIALAVQDIDQALLIKLSEDRFNCTIVDLKTLDEVVKKS